MRQFYKFAARYVRFSPASTRAMEPANRIRMPTEPGVGLFLYPAAEWKKHIALATGPLGETHSHVHPSRFEIIRELPRVEKAGEMGEGEAAITQPELLYWGIGGSVRVTKNLLSGVSEGFAVTLELHGIGFRVEADEERNLAVFRLGLSHIIEMPLVDGDVFFNIVNSQLLQVAGINRAHVHQMAAKVRSLRPPEPYKGKGIRYKSEPVRRKATRKD